MLNEDVNGKLYRYVKVVYDRDSAYSYSYLDSVGDLSVGDYVWVPVGRYNEEKLAYVVSVGEYTIDNVPFPLERTKKVLRAATDDEVARAEENW